jgi:RES domain-containing protein
MPIELYRICKSKYSDDLSGNGAKLFGGRWNSKGIPVVYTSGTKALAVLELLVHTPINLLPNNLKIITISIPDKTIIDEYIINQLPKDWKTYPSPLKNQLLGDKWIHNGKALVLKVPSVIINSEFNFLINPHHSDISKVRIIKKERFEIDERLHSVLSGFS